MYRCSIQYVTLSVFRMEVVKGVLVRKVVEQMRLIGYSSDFASAYAYLIACMHVCMCELNYEMDKDAR